jgi:hypothetical protein
MQMEDPSRRQVSMAEQRVSEQARELREHKVAVPGPSPCRSSAAVNAAEGLMLHVKRASAKLMKTLLVVPCTFRNPTLVCISGPHPSRAMAAAAHILRPLSTPLSLSPLTWQ